MFGFLRKKPAGPLAVTVVQTALTIEEERLRWLELRKEQAFRDAGIAKALADSQSFRRIHQENWNTAMEEALKQTELLERIAKAVETKT